MIEGKERTIEFIFGSKRRYRIPDYQRPYAWEEEQTGKLLEDLYGAFAEGEMDYFLGSLVFVKASETDFEVVDGQQRLCTLAILLSVLIHSLSPDKKGEYETLLNDKTSLRADSPREPRITARDNDRGSLDLVQTLNLDKLPAPDSGSRIAGNVRLLQALAEERFESDDETLDFIDFILENCYVVEVVSDNLESAFRMFSVLNSRGLDLSPVDLVKSKLFQQLGDGQRAIYSRRWDEAEEAIGSAGMNEVLAHVRFMLIPAKGRKSIFEEISEFLDAHLSASDFLDNWFLPAIDAYAEIKRSPDPTTSTAARVDSALGWLNQIGNADWMPAALLFLAGRPTDQAATSFFEQLERLAAYLQAKGANVNARLARYGQVVSELRRAGSSCFIPASLEMTPKEQAEFIGILDGDIYSLPSYRRKYLLMRLNEMVSDGAVAYSPRRGAITIEHVLPQTMAPDSRWAQQWTPEEHDRWCHKLANLVLLTGRANSAAQNYDFERKKREYFAGKSGTSSFALTTQVLSESEWTPAVVERRQKELIITLKDTWNLRDQGENHV